MFVVFLHAKDFADFLHIFFSGFERHCEGGRKPMCRNDVVDVDGGVEVEGFCTCVCCCRDSSYCSNTDGATCCTQLSIHRTLYRRNCCRDAPFPMSSTQWVMISLTGQGLVSAGSHGASGCSSPPSLGCCTSCRWLAERLAKTFSPALSALFCCHLKVFEHAASNAAEEKRSSQPTDIHHQLLMDELACLQQKCDVADVSVNGWVKGWWEKWQS